MNNSKLFEKFLVTQNSQAPLMEFLPSLFATIFVSWILGILYIRFGRSLSNRQSFAHNFILLSTTTMIVISIVKSSLALSLGLVGALSIVRFRAAIKEPEELCFLFLSIVIGLGYGANQVIIMTVSIAVVFLLIVIRGYWTDTTKVSNLHFTISTKKTDSSLSLSRIVEILQSNCSEVNLNRCEETEEGLEASFLTEFQNFKQLQAAKESLQAEDSTIRLTFLDNRGLVT